jgi:hypothetical protein
MIQEGYLAEHAVGAEDREAAQESRLETNNQPDDSMQGLRDLDVAGPRPE